MSVLVIAEHDNKALKSGTLNAVAAAQALGGEVTVLVAGSDCAAAAEAAAALPGVAKVLKADSAEYGHQLAENLAPLIAKLAEGHGHLVAAASTFGKNVLPRAAALLDMQQISDVSGIVDGETFVRPIYAGNALATVKSADPIKVLTVRTTSFDPVAETGGSAAVEEVAATGDSGLSSFVGQELTKSERPELTTARIIVSGAISNWGVV